MLRNIPKIIIITSIWKIFLIQEPSKTIIFLSLEHDYPGILFVSVYVPKERLYFQLSLLYTYNLLLLWLWVPAWDAVVIAIEYHPICKTTFLIEDISVIKVKLWWLSSWAWVTLVKASVWGITSSIPEEGAKIAFLWSSQWKLSNLVHCTFLRGRLALEESEEQMWPWAHGYMIIHLPIQPGGS